MPRPLTGYHAIAKSHADRVAAVEAALAAVLYLLDKEGYERTIPAIAAARKILGLEVR